jgi:hypothetical protein
MRILTPVGEAGPDGEDFVADWMAKVLQMPIDLPANGSASPKKDHNS